MDKYARVLQRMRKRIKEAKAGDEGNEKKY